MNYSFFVSGIPRPGGSKKAFLHSKTGKIIVQDAGKYTKAWRAEIAQTAAYTICKGKPIDGPISLTVHFHMPRPKSHYNSKGQLISGKYYHTSKPDTTKLLRALEDALTGILWNDDSQIVFQIAEKHYADMPGAKVFVEELECD